ncbi:hypothetical protein KC330_g182 [Hortaea werneckii]|nr:hypothetical protein KC330_g182 [Hortaea werneckii]
MPESDCPRIIALGNGVWLDEIRNEGAAPIKDVPGGSVTFSTLGARLFTPRNPECVSMVFNAGGDFPGAVIDIFKSWSITLTIHHQSDKPSSRGLVFYERANGNRKGFQRLTEPLPVEVTALQGTKMLSSRAFTFFGTPEYIESQTSHIEELRTFSRRAALEPLLRAIGWMSSRQTMKSLLVSSKEMRIPSLIVLLLKSRLGILLIVVLGPREKDVLLSGQLDTAASKSHMVVDPTGAGNAFLGAFAIGFQERGSFIEAANLGTATERFGTIAITSRPLMFKCSTEAALAIPSALFPGQYGLSPA